MNKHLLNTPLAFALAVATTSGTSFAQASTSGGNSVNVVITVEAHHGKVVPVINPEDVMVYEGHDRDKVTGVVPLTGDHAGLELFLLIDDAADGTFDIQLGDLKQFINSQPASTAIGVGYMRNGTVEVVQTPTTDHAQTAKSLRIPLGNPGASTSPYFSIVDLTKKWTATPLRREVLMMSDGIDRFGESGPDDIYVDEAIDGVQKAGITVYSIYTPGIGHYGHSFWRINWGQNYLGELSDKSGGEMYNYMTGPAVSFTPFLDELSNRLTHQLLVTFIPKPESKPGLRAVRFRTEVPNAELVGPDRVYVP